MQDLDMGVSAKVCMCKIFDAMPTFMTMLTEYHKQLAASFEYNSILYTKAIKKQ